MIRLSFYNWFIQIDRQFRILLSIIIVFGFVTAFAAYPYTRAEYELIRKFIFYMPLSLMAMYWTSFRNKKDIIMMSYFGYIIFALLLSLNFVGHVIRSSNRWISISSFTIQPSELFKPFYAIISTIFILKIKNMIEKKAFRTKQFIYTVFIYIFITVSTLFSLFKQPNISMMFTFAAIIVTQLFVAGTKWKYLLLLFMCVVLLLIPSYYQNNHVRKRIDLFLSLEFNDFDQQGAAIRAIKESGLVGKGGGYLLKQYVPDVHTDFIFTAICKSFGIIIGTVLIIVMFLFIIRGFRLLRKMANDDFSVILGSGILSFLYFQIMVNFFTNLRLMPPTGIILPFISYGGSGYLSASISVGILISLFHINLPEEIYIEDKNNNAK